MKVIIQGNIYDLSLVYRISKLYKASDIQWAFAMSIVGKPDIITIFLASGYGEFTASLGKDTNDLTQEDWSLNSNTWHSMSSERKSYYQQQAEKKSKNLYDQILIQWADSKQTLPFPTFNT